MDQGHEKIYSVLLDVSSKLGAVGADIKSIKDEQEKMRISYDKRFAGLETEVAELNDFSTNVKAKVGILAGIVGFVASVGMDFIKGFFGKN